jgi:hypothetical protein
MERCRILTVMKIKILLACLAMAGMTVVFGCKKKSEESVAAGDQRKNRMSESHEVESVPKVDFAEATRDPKFQQAVKEAAALLGAEAKPLDPEVDLEEPIKGGVSFEVSKKKIEAILLKTHMEFLAKGVYLFRYQQNFEIGGAPDKVALLPTGDKYAVIAAMETNGANYNTYTPQVIAWLKALEAEQPFVLTGIGFDYMEGQFTTPVKDPAKLAKRMYDFCPDIVDQGVGSVEALAKALKGGQIYFWWD